MSGPAAVVALVLLEWTSGLAAGAAWTQSWAVVRRGHFKIVAWTVFVLAVLAATAGRAADAGGVEGILVTGVVVVAAMNVALQYSRSEVPGIVAGYAVGAVGGASLAVAAGLVSGWAHIAAGLALIVGAGLVGAVTNGMLLGHWYLNQPGLKPWALGRLTDAALVTTAASLAAGALAAPLLATASTEGAVLGLPGFGDSFALVFFGIWAALVLFTGAVVWAARRCIKIRSIQSATGLYYVALLTAGVSEFLVRYLMVNAS
ncbi:MAG: hypothetical protein M3516_09210 [Actinomycetota bacterium]|nr:hypothetical protein [Actinomycetota bacterium]